MSHLNALNWNNNMYFKVKVPISLPNISLLGLLLVYTCNINPVMANDDFNWAKVEMSIAMIRVISGMSGYSYPISEDDNPLNCLAFCTTSTNHRTSKVKLTFPDGFQSLLENILDGSVGTAYFSVSSSQAKSTAQKIYFDFYNMKMADDRRHYIQRSADYGKVIGGACYPKGGSLFLNSVTFENTDHSKIITLYPQNTPEATTTGGALKCGGPYVSEKVKPFIAIDWSKIELSIATLNTAADSGDANCAAKCPLFAKYRTTRVKLSFPKKFQAFLKERLGGSIGTAYFYVRPDNALFKDQIIYFDSNETKIEEDGRLYIDRAATKGKISKGKCYPKNITLILDSVIFENIDGSKFITLYPQNSLEVTSSDFKPFSCGAPYVSSSVLPLA